MNAFLGALFFSSVDIWLSPAASAWKKKFSIFRTINSNSYLNLRSENFLYLVVGDRDRVRVIKSSYFTILLFRSTADVDTKFVQPGTCF